ncbi:MAG: bifunctional glutamate N-acetyltransferase/amino-acid acetyltransferase ArgJ [Dehalococcoidales bacterium]
MKTSGIEFINRGTVTSPRGFVAGATHAGIKKDPVSLDLGILSSEASCATAGMFTQTRIISAPVRLDRQRLQEGRATAIVTNSGCSNSYTGEQGMADAIEMAALAAEGIGIDAEEVLVASTGVTGQLLPMELIKSGISQVILDSDGGHDLARAIMTTDTVPKEAAVFVKAGDIEFTIGGVAKGSGMIHPNMATMFCFLTTDAAVELGFLKSALQKAMSLSLHMITIDGDTSPSDTVVLMANGLAGNEVIIAGNRQAEIFQEALNEICIFFAKALARDGEGATRLIEVTVNGGLNDREAGLAARSVVSSTLVKTAVYGGDPNWDRIIMALSNSGAEIDESKIDLTIGDVPMLKNSKPLTFSEARVIAALKQDVVPIAINFNLGTGSATAWGCDMSEAYVTINSEYMT